MRETTTKNLETAFQAGKELHVLDVREEEEYISGHIPGAINLPLSQLEEQMDQLDPMKDYQVICQAGGRSLTAGQILALHNFQVTNVIGGMSEWQGPTEEGL